MRILALNIAFLFFFGSFSLENQYSIVSIEVFYYENKGAWTEHYEKILEIYKKKCLITERRKIDKILDEVNVIESTKTKSKHDVDGPCNFVIKLNYSKDSKIIGFDNRGNDMIYINNDSYITSGKLLKIIKRNCMCKWNTDNG